MQLIIMPSSLCSVALELRDQGARERPVRLKLASWVHVVIFARRGLFPPPDGRKLMVENVLVLLAN